MRVGRRRLGEQRRRSYEEAYIWHIYKCTAIGDGFDSYLHANHAESIMMLFRNETEAKKS